MLQNMPLSAKPNVTFYPPAVEIEVFFGGTRDGAKFLSIPVTVDGTLTGNALNSPYQAWIFPGTIMGRVSATQKFANSIIGLTTAAYTAGATTLTVSAATAAEIVRRIGTTGTLTFTGTSVALGTVYVQQTAYSAVNTTSGVITLTAMTYAIVSGSCVGASDGSQQALTVVCDLNGLKLVDGTNINRIDVYDPQLLQSGGLLNDNGTFQNWPADIATRNFLRSQISAFVGGVTFYGTDIGQ
jgi:hypothetical protein